MKINDQLKNGEMKKSMSAKNISLSTFDFLQGEKEDEQYRLLTAVVNGEATLKNLNAEKRQQRRQVATEQPSIAVGLANISLFYLNLLLLLDVHKIVLGQILAHTLKIFVNSGCAAGFFRSHSLGPFQYIQGLQNGDYL